jgi:hypothetical protein
MHFDALNAMIGHKRNRSLGCDNALLEKADRIAYLTDGEYPRLGRSDSEKETTEWFQ